MLTTGISEHLFVYGTLVSGANHPMHGVLARHADLVGTGVFNGRLYQVAHYPGAVPSTEPADRVFGELYRLRNAADVLTALDEYEGCGSGAVHPMAFVRTLELVTLADGTRI